MAVVVAVLSDLDGIFALKLEKRTALKTFIQGNEVVTVPLTDFRKSSVKHFGASWLTTRQ